MSAEVCNEVDRELWFKAINTLVRNELASGIYMHNKTYVLRCGKYRLLFFNPLTAVYQRFNLRRDEAFEVAPPLSQNCLDATAVYDYKLYDLTHDDDTIRLHLLNAQRAMMCILTYVQCDLVKLQIIED